MKQNGALLITSSRLSVHRRSNRIKGITLSINGRADTGVKLVFRIVPRLPHWDCDAPREKSPILAESGDEQQAARLFYPRLHGTR